MREPAVATSRPPVRTDGSQTAGVATWRDPRWRSEALAWATAQLAASGLERDGEAEQPHVRTWSTAFRLPLRGGGAAWLKSVGPGSAQEPVVAGALGGWVPDRVLVPLGADPGRRLLLLPDGGPTLRESGAGIAAWERMLQAYAALQVDLVPHAGAMLDLGVPDTRPELLPDLVEDLLADDEAQLVGRPGGLAADVARRLLAVRDDVVRDCQDLADGGLPASLQHDDLHDGNVFLTDGRFRFFDWGDASVSHPFLGLLVTLRMAGRALALPSGDPGLIRLRDAYLEPWAAYSSPRELRRQCDVALRVARLARALTWRRILRGVHPDERAAWAGSVPGWTAEYLAPGPLSAVSR